jgi:AraC-like DNA-binding protein
MPTETEELIPVLEQQIIPWWERFGMEHLAVTASTLRAFHAQNLPDQMRTSIKKRVGKRVISRRKIPYGNSVISSWPEDGQRSLRYPALVCVLRGEADFHIADYVVHCPQGHFLFFRPGVPQPDATKAHLEGDNRDNRYCEVLWFVVHPGTNCVTLSICCSQGDKHWARNGMKFRMVAHPDVLHFFEFFTKEVIQQSADSTPIATTSFATFLRLYLRELREGRFHLLGQRTEPAPSKEALSSIELAQQYINIHLNQSLTTANVAQAVFMSRTNFVRCFRRETGQTFNSYLNAQRFKEASRLLGEGDWPMESIARYVGLKPPQFRALIKRHANTTPTELRCRLRKLEQK